MILIILGGDLLVAIIAYVSMVTDVLGSISYLSF